MARVKAMKKGTVTRAPRLKGIGADAKILGVTRQHLRLVLLGERESDSLLQRWLALEQSRKNPNQPTS